MAEKEAQLDLAWSRLVDLETENEQIRPERSQARIGEATDGQICQACMDTKDENISFTPQRSLGR